MSSVPEVSSEERELYQGVSDTPTSYAREGADVHPPPDFAPYKSTALRHPKEPLVFLPQSVTEVTGPRLGDERVVAGDDDLTGQHEWGADRGADHGVGSRVGYGGQAVAGDVGGGVAGERGGALSTFVGSVAGGA